MKRASIYIAGPMRGHYLYNFPSFFRAAIQLRARSWNVINPAEHDMSLGFNPDRPMDHYLNVEVFDINEALEWDLQQIAQVDAIAFLPGWRESVGAKLEFEHAKKHGLLIYEIDSLDPFFSMRRMKYDVAEAGE